MKASRTTVLFDRYLRLREEGAVDAAEQVLASSGDGERDELRSRIDLHESLETIGDLVATPEGAEREVFGRFQRRRTLARGGMSEVFLAWDPALDREVAVKVLAAGMVGGSEGRALIVNEARALAHLRHPGVVQVFDVDEHEGAAFVAMEQVDGPSLASVLEAMAGREPADADARAQEIARELEPIEARCRLVRDLARALHYCHGRGVIHRDVKPGNVLIADGLRPVLIDFGLATVLGERHTTTHLTQGFVGTPAYISPEQVNDRRTGASALSDQFSLGVVLFQLLTLQNPFDRPKSREGTLDAIARAEPPRPRSLEPRVPVDLERVCLHCLEKAPQDRYDHVGAVAIDLEALLDHRAISVAPPSPWSTAARWARRRRRELAIAAGTAALALAVGAGAWTSRARAGQAQLEDDLAIRVARLAERPERESPATWEATVADLRALDELSAENAEARRGFWRARLVPDLEPDVQKALEEASLRMRHVLDRLREDSDATGLAFDRGSFQEGLALERVLCPWTDRNRADWERGRVLFSDELSGLSLRFFERRRSVRDMGLFASQVYPVLAFWEIPPRELFDATQMYRLCVTESGGAILAELEFFGRHGWEEPLRLGRVHRSDPTVATARVDFEERGLQSALRGVTSSEAVDRLTSPSYMPSTSCRIGIRPISWRELAEHIGQDECLRLRWALSARPRPREVHIVSELLAACLVPAEPLTWTELDRIVTPRTMDFALRRLGWPRVLPLPDTPPTRTELAALVDDPLLLEETEAIADADGAARVPLELALDYARARGMRLPTGIELLAARLVDAVPPLRETEWLADPSLLRDMQIQVPGPRLEAALATGERPDLPRLLGGVPRSNIYDAFRLCVSDGHLE